MANSGIYPPEIKKWTQNPGWDAQYLLPMVNLLKMGNPLNQPQLLWLTQQVPGIELLMTLKIVNQSVVLNKQ